MNSGRKRGKWYSQAGLYVIDWSEDLLAKVERGLLLEEQPMNPDDWRPQVYRGKDAFRESYWGADVARPLDKRLWYGKGKPWRPGARREGRSPLAAVERLWFL